VAVIVKEQQTNEECGGSIAFDALPSKKRVTHIYFNHLMQNCLLNMKKVR